MSWVKLHRQLVDWQWYDEPNTFRLFLHILLKANFEQKDWHGVTIKPGQLITGRKQLAKELKLSEQEIRTSLTRLKSTKEITIKTTNKFSIITICKWDSYQSINEDEQPTKQPSEQPTTNQQLTTTKEYKNIRNKREEKTNRFQPPLLDEFEKYFVVNGFSSELANRAFNHYSVASWKDTTGKQVKNWKQKCQSVWFKPENKSTNGHAHKAVGPATGLKR